MYMAMGRSEESIAKIISLILIVTSTFLYLAEADMKFGFSYFNQSDEDNYVLIRDATSSTKGIYLTRSHYDENLYESLGWMVYKDPIKLWCKSSQLANFQTHFQFVIEKGPPSPNNTLADGIAFFIAPFGSEPPVNGLGMWLGLFNETTNGKIFTQTVAVEYDTFRNPHDPDDNHVGIDVNNITSVATYSLPKIQRLNGNITWDTWIEYNATNKSLRVFLTNDGSKPLEPILSYGINLLQYLPKEVLVGFSASTGRSFQIHSIISWKFSMQTPWTGDCDERSTIVLILVIVISCLVPVLAMLFVLFGFARRLKTRSQRLQNRRTLSRYIKLGVQGRRPREYKYKELRAATNNFSDDQKLGEGGFGSVYKGVLKDTGETAAVKRISAGSKQGSKEYLSEVTIIDQLSHRSLVPLLRWCHEKPNELLLVYKFMSNGSLDKYLFRSSRGPDPPTLEWKVRYKIACDLASSLLYLHDEFEKRVVHRDIKSSNIMLDSEFQAKLSDFGLARVIEDGHTSHFTSPSGTRGYLAPESVISGIASAETDVFSFGVVALEIASGRPALDGNGVALLEAGCYWPLVGWVWDLYGKNRLLDAADSRLNGVFDPREMRQLMVIGLWCCNPDCKQRPTMKQLIHVLNFEAPLPCLPQKMPRVIIFQQNCPSDGSYFSEFDDSVRRPATETGVTADRNVEEISVPVTL